MDYAIVAVPAAPVRRKARHQSEMTNQLLFGDAVQIIKGKGPLWKKVRSLNDNYEGWVTRTLLREVSEEEAKAYRAFVAPGMINTVLAGEEKIHIPLGSSLPRYANGEFRIGENIYHFEGEVLERNALPPAAELITKLTHVWLNAPYMWGGKTVFGVDCSGFVQMNFKMMGIDLPRDAWQQAQEGKTVEKLKNAVCGDLAFFDDKEEIVHVGVLLSKDEIIHSSGKVRIDTIDKKGIINKETGKRSHSLRVIKRLW
jgi:gamma-D-glutamyl-L-lysine dipeptidyl-peptidase